jgi:hypothetical protein
VTIKEVVLDLAEAKREVDRLNRLNESKGCRYFWQGTCFFDDGGSFGSGQAWSRSLIEASSNW